jgi:four helix bundle protein
MTCNFPKEELYGLTSQMRRSAVSIPSNIAEGAARNSNKEFLQFLYVSLGSLSELETQLIISKNLGFQTDSKLDSIEILRRKMLNFIKYLKKKHTH